MSSDDEPALPAWLVEQASAQKERAHDSRIADSSDEYSELDGNSDAEDTKQAAGASGESKGKEGGNAAKAKSRGRAPPSARLPLVLAPKVRRDTLLLEASDPNLDLSGDFGCIGKLHVRRSGGASASTEGDGGGGAAEPRQTLMLDLKGKVYDANLLPCNTMCLVAVDGSKAKVGALLRGAASRARPGSHPLRACMGGTSGGRAHASASYMRRPMGVRTCCVERGAHHMCARARALFVRVSGRGDLLRLCATRPTT